MVQTLICLFKLCPEREDVNICSGPVYLFDQFFVSLALFSNCGWAPKPSPSRTGFSKWSITNIRGRFIYFLCGCRERKECLCFCWRRSVSLCFRLQAEPLLCTGNDPLLPSPLRVSWLETVGKMFHFFLAKRCLSKQQLEALCQMSCSSEQIQYVELQKDFWKAEESF